MSLPEKPAPPARPIISRSPSVFNNGAGNGFPAAPASWALPAGRDAPSRASNAVLELSDGSAFQGISFGATDKSVAGECVFQTGESSLGALDSFFSCCSTFFARLYESFAYTCIYSANLLPSSCWTCILYLPYLAVRCFFHVAETTWRRLVNEQIESHSYGYNL